MDCLFTDKEVKEMLIYARELKERNLDPVIYAAPDWNVINSSWTSKYIDIPITYTNEGEAGMYYGMPIYVFEGLDSHTCCVLPRFFTLPF